MTKSLRQILLAGVIAAAILVPASSAWADFGDGIQGGPFLLHPGVNLSVGYDTNLYYLSSRDSSGIRHSPEGTIEPRLSIETIESGAWDLSGEASLGWRQYFTDDATVRNQSGLSAGLSATALWNEEGTFSLRFTENFVRTNETPNYATPQAINRIYNRAGIMAGLHPGGRVLETFASYDFSIYRHNRFNELDRFTHNLGWRGHWSFLPKTAFVAEADYRLIRYQHPFQGTQTVTPEGQLRNADSTPLRLRGGLKGLITPRISLGLHGGYGWGFYEDGPDFSSWLAQVEASYQFGTIEFDNRLRAGYERGFRDSSVGNYYTFHRGVAGYEHGLVGNRLRLELEVDAQIRDYADLGLPPTIETAHGVIQIPDSLSDLLLGVGASATYQIRKGWNMGFSYGFRSNFTDDEIVVLVGPGENSVRDYQRHHMLLTTELYY